MMITDGRTVERVETLISNDGKVAITVPMMPARAKGYRLVDAKNLIIDLISGGPSPSVHRFAMAETASGAWQILVDTETLLLIEQSEELETIVKSFEVENAVLFEQIGRIPELVQIFREVELTEVQPLFAMPERVAARPDLASRPDVAAVIKIIERQLEILSNNLRDYWISPIG